MNKELDGLCLNWDTTKEKDHGVNAEHELVGGAELHIAKCCGLEQFRAIRSLLHVVGCIRGLFSQSRAQP